VKKSNAANFSCQNSNRLLHRFKWLPSFRGWSKGNTVTYITVAC